MRKILTGVLLLTFFAALLAPAVALAEDLNPVPPQQLPGDQSSKESVFGEVMTVDPTAGELTLKTRDGEVISLAIDGADIQLYGTAIAPGDIAIGQRLGTVGEVIDGVIHPTVPVVIRPDEPSIHHYTGIISETIEGGFAIQDDKAAYAMDLPEYVAIDIVNKLSTLDPSLTGQDGSSLQQDFRRTLGEYIPQEAWKFLSPEASSNIAEQGWGFVPSEAFGQMRGENMGFVPPKAFEVIDPNAFQHMSDEGFKYMPPQAFPYIQS